MNLETKVDGWTYWQRIDRRRGQMYEGREGCTDGQMDKLTQRLIDRWIYRQTDKLMDGLTDRQKMDEQ